MKKRRLLTLLCALVVLVGGVFLYTNIKGRRIPYDGPITPAKFSGNEPVMDGFGYRDFDRETMLKTYGEVVDIKELYTLYEETVVELHILENSVEFVGARAIGKPFTAISYEVFYSTNKDSVFYRDIRIGDKLADILKKFPSEERELEPSGSVTVQPVYGVNEHMGQYAHIALKDGKPEVLFLAEQGHLLCILLDETETVTAVAFWSEGTYAIVKRGSDPTIY